MNRHVNSISGRLSLRPPQRQSLEILDRLTEIVSLKKDTDMMAAIKTIASEFPTVSDFERDFPSLCFALATGVGKTRLMGAFIAYLHLAHGINNFFVMAPNLTIYNKLITDFTPNTPKYVFKGIAEFATEPPSIITGDNYEAVAGSLFDQVLQCKINIFNIAKINSEVRGGKMPRIKRLSEYIGDSYFNYLSELKDLVLIMDESHRYRASAGVKAINELKPILGLELTATPFVEGPKAPTPFKNIIYDYSLRKAMEDGFVKEPAAVTKKDFNPTHMSTEEIERLKLEDGIALHERVKVELETYARETNNKIIKPFVLVISRDTTHASQLLELIKSDRFFDGRYKDKVIQVDSSTKEDEVTERLLKVEDSNEPTEIVIHVNMLKEGWDVTNLYTIIPLRAANARTLIEQSIGRGLRLPYGKRTGVKIVDTLNIIAHDKFQEIIDEAKNPNSIIRMQQIILDPDQLAEKKVTVVVQSCLANELGITPANMTSSTKILGYEDSKNFTTAEERKVAQLAYEVIQTIKYLPNKMSSAKALQTPEMQSYLNEQVAILYKPAQLELDGVLPQPNIAKIIAQTTEVLIQNSIDIPRILILPKTIAKSGFKKFELNLKSLNYAVPSDDLWIQNLRTQEREVFGIGDGGVQEKRMEDYIVSALTSFDDIPYDDNADLLYDLANQVTKHFLKNYNEDEVRKILKVHQKEIGKFVYVQMQDYRTDETFEYEIQISDSFDLKPPIHTVGSNDIVLDYRHPPSDKSNMAKYLFGGFNRCLYKVQRFQSDSERRLSVILDRDALKWFKPVKGQFYMSYKLDGIEHDYLPDFVAETEDCTYMLEPKAKNEMNSADVIAKTDVAVRWCQMASDYAKTHGNKPWKYVLIPHDVITENLTFEGLIKAFSANP